MIHLALLLYIYYTFDNLCGAASEEPAEVQEVAGLILAAGQIFV